jgi:hypothetical protein
MTGQSAGLYMALPADWNPSSARHACCRRDRAPGFQGQLRAATAADGLFYLQAEACGNHFGDLVWALHNCAHQRGATPGTTDLAGRRPPHRQQAQPSLRRNPAASDRPANPSGPITGPQSSPISE